MSGAVLRTLAVRISANTAQFRKDIDKVDRRFKRFSSGMRREAMMFQGQMAALGATVASGFGVAEVVRAADEMTNLRNKMNATFDSTSDVAKGMLQIKTIARTSRADIAAVGTLYQRIAVSTQHMGLEQHRVAKVTQVVADSFLMSGTTASEAANSARQFAQGLASGTLRGDEFRSVSENNVILTKMLADGLGMTVGQLRLFSQAGGLTAETIIPILEKGFFDTRKAVDGMNLTISQSIVLFRNAFTEMVDRMNQIYNVTGKAARVIKVLADNVGVVTLALGGLASLLLGRLLVGMVAFIATTITGAVTALFSFGTTAFLVSRILLNVFLGALMKTLSGLYALGRWLVVGVIAAFKGFFALLVANPISAVVVAVAALAAGLGYVISKMEFMERASILFEGISMQVEAIADSFKNTGDKIAHTWAKAMHKAKSMFADFLEAVGQDEWALKIRSNLEEVGAAPTARDAVGKMAAGRRLAGTAFSSEGPGLSFTEAVSAAKSEAGGVLSAGKDFVMSGAGAVMDAIPSFEDLKTNFSEFVATVGTTAMDAIPGFRQFWAALKGNTDPDLNNLEGTEEGEDTQMSWAERWTLAVEKVKEAFGTLSMAIKGRVNSMKQSYETWDGVLQAGARRSKKIAALQRGLMLKEAIVMQGKAIMAAWGAAPFPANLPGVALTTAQTALVLKDIMSGQAHDGIDSLPSTGTYMLERGERVVSSRTNRDLTQFLADKNNRPATGAPLTLQINGVADPDLVFNALQQRQGELTDMIRSISDENVVAAPF